jgi:1-acyl-sn-glycerol-3-phosphate acyltransferase
VSVSVGLERRRTIATAAVTGAVGRVLSDQARMSALTKRTLTPLYRILFPVRVVGAANVPLHGGAILAPNHLSFFDTVVLMFSLRRGTRFIGKAEYMDSWKTKYLFPAMGMIPIERQAGRQAMAALDTAASALRRGELLVIYPEGTRSRDGNLHRGHAGVAELALATGAPIVPIGLVGTDRIQPIGARVPRPFRRAVMRVGPPLRPADYGGPKRRRRQQMTGDLMEAIRSMSGQPMSSDFASDEPPLVRGGSESVYEVMRVIGSSAADWRTAARFGVGSICERWDDARVGEVKALRCDIDAAGQLTFLAELSVSIKVHDGQALALDTPDGRTPGEEHDE